MESKGFRIGMGGGADGTLNSVNFASPTVRTLVTTPLIGKTTAQNNLDTIWQLLVHEDVSRVGVWGMGGVGKTTLMTHIYNWLVQEKRFRYVYWVTVSQKASIFELQERIANQVNIENFSEVREEKMRAALLYDELKKRNHFVLILDDVWKKIALEDVGIWMDEKSSKLVVTTREKSVCNQMGCKEPVEVKPLNEEEAWELFLVKLNEESLTDEIKKIARSVADECAGLPLVIAAIAGAMSGVQAIEEWKDLERELKESRGLKMHEEVFELLKLSYNRLGDGSVQHCLLYCALYPEDYKFERKELIGHLIDGGLIKGDSMQARCERGHTIVNKLVNACLLESVAGLSVKMHDVIRDMAIQITSWFPKFMVKAGVGLVELPNEECWEEDLQKVSLVENSILEIPLDLSPVCHQLSTLLLSDNLTIRAIPDSFFAKMKNLRMLDLSKTSIEILPNSVCDMRTLTTLLLRKCYKLVSLPALEHLTALEKLDLYRSSIAKVPEGTEKLQKLRTLNLSRTHIKAIPNGLLYKVNRLECLMVGDSVVAVEDLMRLAKLEILECGFKDVREYYRYMRWCWHEKKKKNKKALTEYNLLLAKGYSPIGAWRFSAIEWEEGKDLFICGREFTAEESKHMLLLPNDIEKLVVLDVKGISNMLELCLSSEEEKCNTETSTSFGPLESLKIIMLSYLDTLSELLPANMAPFPPSSFSHLKELKIEKCFRIKYLFPPGLLFPSLERLNVHHCASMEEIFVAAAASDHFNNNNDDGSIGEDRIINLPKLECLDLRDLPQLKSICGQGLFVRCDSICKIFIWRCEKLKRLPLYMPAEIHSNAPPPFLSEIIIYSESWWNSLEWDPIPNRFSKYLLAPFICEPSDWDQEYISAEIDNNAFLSHISDSYPKLLPNYASAYPSKSLLLLPLLFLLLLLPNLIAFRK